TPPTQSQPQQPAVSPPTKSVEQEAHSQPPPQSQPAKTAIPRSAVRQPPEPAVPDSTTTRASIQESKPAAAAPVVPASDVRSIPTASTDNSKIAANTTAPVTPTAPVA